MNAFGRTHIFTLTPGQIQINCFSINLHNQIRFYFYIFFFTRRSVRQSINLKNVCSFSFRSLTVSTWSRSTHCRLSIDRIFTCFFHRIFYFFSLLICDFSLVYLLTKVLFLGDLIESVCAKRWRTFEILARPKWKWNENRKKNEIDDPLKVRKTSSFGK